MPLQKCTIDEKCDDIVTIKAKLAMKHESVSLLVTVKAIQLIKSVAHTN